MKLGILSDTHGWLDPALHHWFAGVDLILHAGDVGTESVLIELELLAPTLAVRGNVDGDHWGYALPLERMVLADSKQIAMLHIAGSPKRPTAAAQDLLTRTQPDIFLVGHSHIPVIERRAGVLWINPGAAGRQGFHTERTAAILHVEDKLTLDWIRLGPRSRPGSR